MFQGRGARYVLQLLRDPEYLVPWESCFFQMITKVM